MKINILVPALASTLLLAAPAFAASTAMNNEAGAASSSQSGSTTSAHLAQTLRQDLTKAGFTDVTVAPEAFIVHAKDSHGEPVLMRIGPDTLTEMTEVPANGKSAANEATTPSNRTASK